MNFEGWGALWLVGRGGPVREGLLYIVGGDIGRWYDLSSIYRSWLEP